jgi:hypothetical protein
MFLDAFVLNQHIFNDSHFIAPLSRPDHSSFLPGAFSKSDAIPFVDTDGAYPWHRNSRIADITRAPKTRGKYDDLLRKERLGVYLHWTLPKQFRSSGAAQEDGNIDVRNGRSRYPVIQQTTLLTLQDSMATSPTGGLCFGVSPTLASPTPRL